MTLVQSGLKSFLIVCHIANVDSTPHAHLKEVLYLMLWSFFLNGEFKQNLS